MYLSNRTLATGREWINKTGWTKFCLRSSDDINSIPPNWMSDEIYFWTREKSWAPYWPKLTVEYYENNVERWIGSADNGTSFSASAVAGEAALLMEMNSWLKYYPYVVKAVIMASAVHNIEGDSRLSDKDGVGAIDCWEAYEIVRTGHFAAHTVLRDDLSTWTWEYNIEASAGRKVRVVLCWMSHTWDGCPPAWDEVVTDYNLYVYDRRGSYITKDTARGRTFQIVEFTAPYSGNYTVVANVYTLDRLDGADYDYLGLAYRS